MPIVVPPPVVPGRTRITPASAVAPIVPVMPVWPAKAAVAPAGAPASPTAVTPPGRLDPPRITGLNLRGARRGGTLQSRNRCADGEESLGDAGGRWLGGLSGSRLG